jgi:hypothetical protein
VVSSSTLPVVLSFPSETGFLATLSGVTQTALYSASVFYQYSAATRLDWCMRIIRVKED